MTRKVTDEAIIKAYEATRNVWRAGELLGVAGQTVQRRLAAIGYPRSNPPYSESENDILRAAYAESYSRGDLNLKSLGQRISRSEESVCVQARKLGLTDRNRTVAPELHANLERAKLDHFAVAGHPRGFKGHKHTDEAKQQIAKTSADMWERLSEADKATLVLKQLKSKADKYGSLATPRPHASWKAGWREIGGKRHYFRSRWEMNYARWLEFRKSVLKEIVDWEYEPEIFWFENIRRGTRSYTPDFKIHPPNGISYFDEVKGWMDERSVTKLRRMKKYHPAVKVNVIDATWFKSHRMLKSVVPGWE